MVPRSPPRRSIVAIGAGGLALSLALAGCSAGGSESEDGKTSLTFLVDNGEATVATAEALAEAFTAENPDISIEVETRPAGRRRRQRRQDAPRHRRDGRHLPVQLGFADAGAQSGRDAREPRRRGVRRQVRRELRRERRDRQRRVRRADGSVDGWSRPLQQGHLRGARPRDPDHVGRVHREQRGDQGGRYRGADRADLRRHVDFAALRARRLQQRPRREPRLGRGVHEQRGEVRRRAGIGRVRAPAGGLREGAASTRTSPRRRTPTA